jgi:glycine/D-amino acid oxidase-like deaminating enzyme
MYIDYDVAVIGAGIIGASIAARLCSAGLAVALIDRGAAGASGASGYSGGLLRLYDADPALMALTALSLGQLAEGVFAETYGKALRRTGVIYRAAMDQAEAIDGAIRSFSRPDYPMRLLSAQEVVDMGVGNSADSQRINLYEPHASIGNVRQASSALANVVRQQGLLLEHCEIQSIDCVSRHEVRLAVGQATLRCRAVVVATGAWTRQLLPDLPLHSRSIPLARVGTAVHCTVPLIDAVSQSYAIPLTSAIVQSGCGLRDEARYPEQLAAPDRRHDEDARSRVQGLLGAAAQPAVLDVLPGFDSYSLNGRPLIGFCSEDSPVFLASGMCGLGFKFAPGVAQIALEQVQQHLAGAWPRSGSWSMFSPQRVGVTAPVFAAEQP